MEGRGGRAGLCGTALGIGCCTRKTAFVLLEGLTVEGRLAVEHAG